MKTFVELLNEREDELRKKIEESRDVEQAIRKVQRSLHQMHSRCISQLSSSQTQVVQFLIDALAKSMDMVTAANQPRLIYSKPLSQRKPQTKTTSSLKNTFYLLLVQLGVCLALIVGLFIFPPINVFLQDFSMFTHFFVWGFIAVIVLLTVMQLVVFQRNRKTFLSATETSTLEEEPEVHIRVDSTSLVYHLRRAVGDIDEAVEAVGKIGMQKDSQPVFLEQYRDFLEFTQQLIGYTRRGQADLLLEHAKQLAGILSHYGIEVEEYEPNDVEKPDALAHTKFEFEAKVNPDIADYTTLRPALVKGERILLRGRVVSPEGS